MIKLKPQDEVRRISLSVAEWKSVADRIVQLMDLLPEDEDLRKMAPSEAWARWTLTVNAVEGLGILIGEITKRVVEEEMETAALKKKNAKQGYAAEESGERASESG